MKKFTEIKKIENITERAITTMLWIMRSQMFMDGNKRVASMFCNKILIENGKEILFRWNLIVLLMNVGSRNAVY